MLSSEIISKYTSEEISYIRKKYCKNSTHEELKQFIYECTTTNLSPFHGQIVSVKRWDYSIERYITTSQVTLDGLRTIAERTGKYHGQIGPLWCGKDMVWRDVWTYDYKPTASKVGILREGFRKPCWGVAVFNTYNKYEKNFEDVKKAIKSPSVISGQCAESIALRKAFPCELSGMYTIEEHPRCYEYNAPDYVEPMMDEIEALDYDSMIYFQECFVLSNWTFVDVLNICSSLYGLDSPKQLNDKQLHELGKLITTVSFEAYMQENDQRSYIKRSDKEYEDYLSQNENIVDEQYISQESQSEIKPVDRDHSNVNDAARYTSVDLKKNSNTNSINIDDQSDREELFLEKLHNPAIKAVDELLKNKKKKDEILVAKICKNLSSTFKKREKLRKDKRKTDYSDLTNRVDSDGLLKKDLNKELDKIQESKKDDLPF